MRRFAHFSAIDATTAGVSSRPTPRRIISPAPTSPVTRPSTVTFARLTLCRTARTQIFLFFSALLSALGVSALSFSRLFLLFCAAAAAKPQSLAAKVGTVDKNSCFVPPQSRAGCASCSDSSFSPRVRKPDGAADILPARLRRQENQKSTILEARSLSAKYPAARGAASPLVSG